MPSLDDMLLPELDALRDAHRYRERAVCAVDGVYIERGGRRYVSFASNDYFGLSQQVAGVGGAGASALITGYSAALKSLESALATAKKTEAALVFGSGYLANIGTISALVGKGDLILADKLAHACMIDGARLSGATLRRFKHNDLGHLKTLLEQRTQYRRCLILTETVFSMDGDHAPLNALAELVDVYDAWLMTDDAHGLGIVESNPAHIQMGTLSKGLGAYGGYVCGSQALIDHLVNHARSYIFTTALPPAIAVATESALSMLMRDEALRAKPLSLARKFTEALGLAEAQSPIVPLVIGGDEAAVKASQILAEAGFWVPAIRPPTVPEGAARLRFSFSALHVESQVNAVVEEVKRHGWA